MTITIAAHADHRPADYRFPRQRSDGGALEKTPPLTSRGALLLRGLLFALASTAVMALASMVGEWVM